MIMRGAEISVKLRDDRRPCRIRMNWRNMINSAADEVKRLKGLFANLKPYTIAGLPIDPYFRTFEMAL